METYVDSKGKVVTAEQAETEFRKQVIAQGGALDGADYDQRLEAWLGTYQKLTKGDKRSISATVVTYLIAFGIAFVVAFIALFTGGGLLAFILILVIGGVVAFLPALLVMMFTTPKKS